MRIKQGLIALTCASALLSGCATTGNSASISQDALCMLATTAGGAGVAGAINGESAGYAGGAIIGGIIGYYMCDDIDSSK